MKKIKIEYLNQLPELHPMKNLTPNKFLFYFLLYLNSIIIGISRGKAALSFSFIKFLCQEFNVQY